MSGKISKTFFKNYQYEQLCSNLFPTFNVNFMKVYLFQRNYLLEQQQKMSLIKNLIKEPEKKRAQNYDEDCGGDGVEICFAEAQETECKQPIIKSAIDLQRLKIEKLMKNPDKPVIIPEASKERDFMHTVPTFVRNVMGSSAGAGSGEFHVYRHLRRKEYARQKHIQAKSYKEQLDEEFQKKLEENRRVAEEKTCKKRFWRLKKKERRRKKKQDRDADKEREESERLDQQIRHPWSTKERIERENDPFKRFESDQQRHLIKEDEPKPNEKDESPKNDT